VQLLHRTPAPSAKTCACLPWLDLISRHQNRGGERPRVEPGIGPDLKVRNTDFESEQARSPALAATQKPNSAMPVTRL